MDEASGVRNAMDYLLGLGHRVSHFVPNAGCEISAIHTANPAGVA